MTGKDDVYNEDWADDEKKIKSAASKGGTFVTLKDDGDEVFIAFVQKVETREEQTDKWGMATRTCANVAVFENNGQNFAGLKILKLAPTHWGTFLEYRREYGGDSVFKIRRKGAAGSKETKYTPFFFRKLKEDEKEAIAATKRHDLWEDRGNEDNDGFPGSYAPEALDKAKFAQAMGVELKRLSWTKEDYMVANKTFLQGNFKAFEDMTPVNRENILAAIRNLVVGSKPSQIGFESGGDVNLDEDVDFF
mgnify:CR=1 FL=1